MCYVASPSGPLQSLFKLLPWGHRGPCPRDHMFYIDLFRERKPLTVLENLFMDLVKY